MIRMRTRLTACLLFSLMVILTALSPALAEAPLVILSTQYAEVATDKGTLNMREYARDNANILQKLPRGAIVEILSQEGDWAEILYRGNTGYVKASFLQRITNLPYTVITPGSDGEDILAFKRILHKMEYLKSDDINKNFDWKMENALVKMQLMNDVTLNPAAVTPELQALIEWGMIKNGKSGSVDTETDGASGLTVSIFCWDTGGILYDDDKAVKVQITHAAQATGGTPPYTIIVKKSVTGAGEASADYVTNPFSHIIYSNDDVLYVYATATDAEGNTVTACAPFSYTLPSRYTD